MSAPKNPEAYKDEYDLMRRALVAHKGLIIREIGGEKSRATYWRNRLNLARAVDRKRNATIFPEGDARRARSDFDALQFVIRQDAQGWYVLLSNSGARLAHLIVEEVAGDDESVVANEPSAHRTSPQKTPPENDIFD